MTGACYCGGPLTPHGTSTVCAHCDRLCEVKRCGVCRDLFTAPSRGPGSARR